MSHRAPLAGLVFLVLIPAQAAAATRSRPLFEPTDLELEDPGTMEVDAQVGELRSPDAAKAVVPDFEVDIGLGRNAELDIDGQYAIEGPGVHGFKLDKPGPDNLWIASKLGLFDERSAAHDRAFALGVQFGPKIPLAPGNKGVGCEGLVLIAGTLDHAQLVFNAGALLDPGTEIASGRPAGIEGGVDLSVGLGKNKALTVLGELGGVRFLSRDAHQFHATAGLSWSVSHSLDLSLIGLKGLLSGGDRYGVLLGVAQRFELF